MNRPTEAEIAAKSARNKAAWNGRIAEGLELATAALEGVLPAKPAPKPKRTFKEAALRAQSNLEIMFEHDIEHDGLPAAVRNYRAIPGRKFEVDFAYPDLKFGVEVQGMAHRIKERFEGDIEKRALLALQGWTILEVSGKTIRDGRAIGWLKDLLKAKGAIT